MDTSTSTTIPSTTASTGGSSIISLPTLEILFGTAPIDWCEPNQPLRNPFQWEEFHNTWSNIAFVLAGCSGLYQHYYQQTYYPRDPLIVWGGICCIMTGITSAWFHATLLFVGQKTDEFFENAMITSVLYVQFFPLTTTTTTTSTPSSISQQRLRLLRYVLCGIHMIVLAVGIFSIPSDFAELHLASVVLLFFYKLSTVAARIGKTNPTVQQTICDWKNTAIVVAVMSFALWALDRFYCTPVIQSLHLHAFAWHFGTALALWIGNQANIVALEFMGQQQQQQEQQQQSSSRIDNENGTKKNK